MKTEANEAELYVENHWSESREEERQEQALDENSKYELYIGFKHL